MKRILLAGLLLTALSTQAQETQLLSREFWKTKPELSTVKAELSKGFDFKTVHGAADPIFLAIAGDAPVATIKYLIDQPGVDLKHPTVEGRSYLHIAANKSNAEITDYLITKGSDMNMFDAHDHTALTFAAYQGSLTIPVTEVFMKHGVDIKQKFTNKGGANLILLEVGFDKDLSLTNYLVSKGVSLNATDDAGNTAFDDAAQMGNVGIMKALREKGVKSSGSALMVASQGTYRTANKIEVYKYLVDELKMDPLVTNKDGQNVLHNITRKRDQDEIITYFVEKGVDVNKADKQGNTPFISASGTKSLAVVQLMLPKVKNINAVNNKGESALLSAVKSSTAEVVNLLIKNGADVKVTDKEGNNLAYYLIDSYRPAGGRGGRFGGAPDPAAVAAAAAQQQRDFAEKLNALQSKGLNMTAPQKDGNTLYHLAVAKNDLAVVKQLSGLKIDVNAKNKEGMTALHKAAMTSKDDTILKYLLTIGAKKDAVTQVDESAYDLAKENEFLSQKNVSVDFLK